MNTGLKKINLEKSWIYIFLLFFISIPLNLFDKGLTGAIMLFAAVAFIIYKFDIKRFPVIVFLLALLLRITAIFLVATPPESDFAILFDASQKMASGNNSYLWDSYFKLWPYQLGFVFYQSLLLRIWNNILILKIANCFLGAGTTVLIYLIAKEFVPKKAAQMLSLMYCCFPFVMFYTSILSNQFIASFLIYLGIYILIITKNKLYSEIRYAILAAFLAVANVLRPESIIPLFSAVLFLVITLKKDNFKENITSIIILIVTYFSLFAVFNGVFILLNISPEGLESKDFLWKFVLGFNHTSGGTYTAADLPYLNNVDAATEVIKQRIFVPIGDMLELFSSKIKTFWVGTAVSSYLGEFLADGLNVFGKSFDITDEIVIINSVCEWIMIGIYLLIFIGVLKYVRSKNYKSEILIILNQVFVTFGVYLLIEVQVRYIYHIQVGLFILAALGVSELYKWVAKFKSSEEKGLE